MTVVGRIVYARMILDSSDGPHLAVEHAKIALADCSTSAYADC